MTKKYIKYASWLLVSLALIVFFLNLPVYFSITDRARTSTLYQASVIFSALGFWLFFSRKKLIPTRYWLSFFLIFLTVTTSHVFMFDDYSRDAWKASSTSLGWIIILSLAFLTAFEQKLDSRWIFLLGGIIAVSLNFIDFFDDGALFEQIDGFGVRAAGFYINANKSAEAILISMALGTGVLKKKARLTFCLFCLTGLALTMSRGGFISWFVLLISMAYLGCIEKRSVFAGIAALLSIGAVISFAVDYGGAAIDVDLILDRIDFFSGRDTVGFSGDSRLGIAGDAYNLFAKNPFYGNGAYSLMREGGLQLAHNEYLQFLADFGIFGLFLYFIFLTSVFFKKEDKENFGPTLVLVLIWGFFSHNITDSYTFLMAFSYLAARRIFFKHEIQREFSAQRN